MSFIDNSFNELNTVLYSQYPNYNMPLQNEAQGDDTETNKTSTTSDTIYHFIDQTNIRTTPRKIRRESSKSEKHRKVERLKNETVKEKQKSAAQKHRENQVKKTEELLSEVNYLTEEIRISKA